MLDFVFLVSGRIYLLCSHYRDCSYHCSDCPYCHCRCSTACSQFDWYCVAKNCLFDHTLMYMTGCRMSGCSGTKLILFWNSMPEPEWCCQIYLHCMYCLFCSRYTYTYFQIRNSYLMHKCWRLLGLLLQLIKSFSFSHPLKIVINFIF